MSNVEDLLKATSTTPTAAAPTTATSGVQSLTSPATATPTAAAATPKAGTTGLAQGSAWKTAVPAKLDDSVASKVAALSSQDSPLMQQAKTDGLKTANRRGLLNSSMAAGAVQDSTLRTVVPIAQQEANQAFQKNMAASDFEYKMTGQENQQQFTAGESALDRTQQADLAKQQRDLEILMQDKNISLADRQQLADITSKEGLAAAERALQEMMQGKQIKSTEQLASDDRELQKFMQGRDITSREGMAKAQRDLEVAMQKADIASRESLAAAERALQERMQQTSIGSQQTMQDKDIAQQNKSQQAEIGYQTAERKLDRGLQEQLAGWNLKSTDRNAAAQLLTNMQGAFQDSYSAIMANTNLDATTREAQITSARNLRDKNLNLVEQMYAIDLKWTDADFGITAPAAAKPAAAAPVAAVATPAAAAKPAATPAAAAPAKKFNAAAYLKANPDVAKNPNFAKDPVAHYLKYGKAEGRTW